MAWDANPQSVDEVLLGGATDPPDQALIVLQGLLGLQDARNYCLKNGMNMTGFLKFTLVHGWWIGWMAKIPSLDKPGL